mmetsp:Transcript_8681/g.12796  ORF Transcript_8681/g.12796 Transcript_8681/m.12796 type:complete len:521 (+) Transcript_8681:30-1592(+)
MGEGKVKRSISLKLIRHAESQNNEVYRQARHIYRGGTPQFDLDGWISYVDKHRSSDPGLSAQGHLQTVELANYLGKHLSNQASFPVRIITSPMRRTLETVMPTLKALKEFSIDENEKGDDEGAAMSKKSNCQVLVNGFYFESEGCHTKDEPEPGMNPNEITNILSPTVQNPSSGITFTGFDESDPTKGWYAHGTGPETRKESEERAAKFYVWLCEYLDNQLSSTFDSDDQEEDDVFDAGVSIPGEEHEREHDKFSPRKRRRRTAILIGHGDFMSLLLKRIIAGFGHMVENEGIPHRTAFVHFNTGITELEYFGAGRFLLMSTNQTPHLDHPDGFFLKTGGSLKDGWSYLVPGDEFTLDAEVSVAFSDEVEEHEREQTEALKSLYLSGTSDAAPRRRSSLLLECLDGVELDGDGEITATGEEEGSKKTFIAKRGLQVVGCATYYPETGRISDVVVRPSAKGCGVGKSLVGAIKSHAKKLGRSGSLYVEPHTEESHAFFHKIGFVQQEDISADDAAKMESKL